MAFGILRVMPVATRWVVSPGYPLPGYEFGDKKAAEHFAVTQAKKEAPMLVEVLNREGELDYLLRY
jgi:hypothetical protein